jgi:hypothetical protein
MKINGLFSSSQQSGQKDDRKQPFPNCVFHSSFPLLPLCDNNKMQALPLI